MTRSNHRLARALLCCLLPMQSLAQEEGSDAGAAPRVHPGQLLGHRAATALSDRTVNSTLVIVPDPASYAAAIGAWTPQSFFPVLIDNGSLAAAEDIARFARSFRPASVVRWSSEEGARPEMRQNRAIPRAEAVAATALARAWGLDGEGDLNAALIKARVEAGRPPAGLVVADARDPAWTAALALASGHGQPMVWIEQPKLGVNGSLTEEEATALCDRIEAECERLGLAWRGLGDVIDAVTICSSLPGRVQTSAEEFAATTDRIGRSADGSRWAWAGQVFGSEPEAAYRAMCSLFLEIGTAWLFDGYGSSQPWGQWDCTAAGEVLGKAGVFAAVDDEPANGIDAWRLRTERPVRADLILINSSGNRSWFDLSGSRGEAGDAAVLDVPSVVHMVHSWSAVSPASRRTVAGRWLERGAYAYVGSVHEPFLQAFVPTPLLARRLIGGMALGSAARIDSGPLWRITVIADPLLAKGRKVTRSEGPVPLEGAASLEDEMKTAATEGRYAAAVRALVAMGRDADASKLIGALLRDKPGALDGELARAGLFAAFRTGHDDEFLQLFAALPEETASDGAAVDALWHLGRRAARENGRYRDAALTLMGGRIREEQQEADAALLQQLGLGRP